MDNNNSCIFDLRPKYLALGLESNFRATFKQFLVLPPLLSQVVDFQDAGFFRLWQLHATE